MKNTRHKMKHAKAVVEDVPLTMERVAILLDRLNQQVMLLSTTLIDLETKIGQLEDDSHEH